MMLPREWHGIFNTVLNAHIPPKRLLNIQAYDQCSQKSFSDRKLVKIVVDTLPFFDLFEKRLADKWVKELRSSPAQEDDNSLLSHLTPSAPAKKPGPTGGFKIVIPGGPAPKATFYDHDTPPNFAPIPTVTLPSSTSKRNITPPSPQYSKKNKLGPTFPDVEIPAASSLKRKITTPSAKPTPQPRQLERHTSSAEQLTRDIETTDGLKHKSQREIEGVGKEKEGAETEQSLRPNKYENGGSLKMGGRGHGTKGTDALNDKRSSNEFGFLIDRNRHGMDHASLEKAL